MPQQDPRLFTHERAYVAPVSNVYRVTIDVGECATAAAGSGCAFLCAFYHGQSTTVAAQYFGLGLNPTFPTGLPRTGLFENQGSLIYGYWFDTTDQIIPYTDQFSEYGVSWETPGYWMSEDEWTPEDPHLLDIFLVPGARVGNDNVPWAVVIAGKYVVTQGAGDVAYAGDGAGTFSHLAGEIDGGRLFVGGGVVPTTEQCEVTVDVEVDEDRKYVPKEIGGRALGYCPETAQAVTYTWENASFPNSEYDRLLGCPPYN
jgi:hypothetical protein